MLFGVALNVRREKMLRPSPKLEVHNGQKSEKLARCAAQSHNHLHKRRRWRSVSNNLSHQPKEQRRSYYYHPCTDIDKSNKSSWHPYPAERGSVGCSGSLPTRATRLPPHQKLIVDLHLHPSMECHPSDSEAPTAISAVSHLLHLPRRIVLLVCPGALTQLRRHQIR